MAQSPSHRFGQIIGEVLESAIHPPLESLVKKHGLYLDTKHPCCAEMARVLKKTGSFYYHCDWHASSQPVH